MNHLALAFLGGVLFNLSNILLVIAIDLAGLAVAFPIGVGLALVWRDPDLLVQPQRRSCAVVHGRRSGDAGHHLQRAGLQETCRSRREPSARRGNRSRPRDFGDSWCADGRGFFGLVSRGMVKNFAQPEAGLMTPYTALVVFAVGLFVSNFV